jgi:PAS domain-containing protein
MAMGVARRDRRRPPGPRLLPAIDREVREARHRGDHRAALEMLNESQARFDALASNLPGMLFHLRRDAEGGYRFLFVSEGCQKLFGFKQQHLLASADKLFDAFDAEKRRSLEQALRDSAAAGHIAQLGGTHARPHQAEMDQPAIHAPSLRFGRRRVARHRQQHHREQGKRGRTARLAPAACRAFHPPRGRQGRRARKDLARHPRRTRLDPCLPQDRGGAVGKPSCPKAPSVCATRRTRSRTLLEPGDEHCQPGCARIAPRHTQGIRPARGDRMPGGGLHPAFRDSLSRAMRRRRDRAGPRHFAGPVPHRAGGPDQYRQARPRLAGRDAFAARKR